MSLPKPPVCPQNWLAMPPVKGGRMCLDCQKVIRDFSQHSWKEIETEQQESNNSICGVYNPKQLKYWGMEVPNRSIKSKLSVILSTLSLSTFAFQPQELFGQELTIEQYQTADSNTIHQPQETLVEDIVIHGKVYEVVESGTKSPLLSALITSSSPSVGTISDVEGNYELRIPIDSLKGQGVTITYSYIGYVTRKIELGVITKQQYNLDVVFDAKTDVNIIAFGVPKPTIWTRIKWTVGGWFRKN